MVINGFVCHGSWVFSDGGDGFTLFCPKVYRERGARKQRMRKRRSEDLILCVCESFFCVFFCDL